MKKGDGKRKEEKEEEGNKYWEVSATEGEWNLWVEWESKGKEEVSRMARSLAQVLGRRVFLLFVTEPFPNILLSRYMYFKLQF